MERLAAEPGVSRISLKALNAILATSHRLAHSLMALEAGLCSGPQAVSREPFLAFANDVELTLYYLASVLRGSSIAAAALPDLREAHHSLCNQSSPLVIVEADRITNSINTIGVELFQWAEREPIPSLAYARGTAS